MSDDSGKKKTHGHGRGCKKVEIDGGQEENEQFLADKRYNRGGSDDQKSEW